MLNIDGIIFVGIIYVPMYTPLKYMIAIQVRQIQSAVCATPIHKKAGGSLRRHMTNFFLII